MARRRLDPDAAAMPLHDSPANRQPDARARILAPCVKTLKDHEDALEVLWGDADAIVPDGEHAFRRGHLRAHVHMWWLAPAELDRVAHKVLQELDKLGLVSHDSRQLVARDLRIRLLDGDAQIDPHRAQC